MMQLPPKITNVFARNAKAFINGHRLIINEGGQGSSKTYSILQLMYIICKQYNGIRASVCSYAFPHLSRGTMLDWERILMSFGENVRAIRTRNTYRIGKSRVEFFGIEGNLAIGHGPRRDILFINECNRRITYEVFDLLASRTQLCVFLDYNPDREFWVHEKVIPNFPHVLIRSNYLDNKYLPQLERENIELKKDKKGFENWWKVYGLGQLGTLENAIISSWHYGEFDTTLPYGYGLDFGVKHHDAMTKVAVNRDKKIIYAKEMIYEKGLSTDQLAMLIHSIDVGRSLIVADSANPRSILDLRSRGLNVQPVQKGRIIDDIKMLNNYEIVVDPDSYNLGKELTNWIWLDKRGEIPIDENDDLIDSMRYYIRTVLQPVKVVSQKLLL